MVKYFQRWQHVGVFTEGWKGQREGRATRMLGDSCRCSIVGAVVFPRGKEPLSTLGPSSHILMFPTHLSQVSSMSLIQPEGGGERS